jgi:hypothetical protein
VGGTCSRSGKDEKRAQHFDEVLIIRSKQPYRSRVLVFYYTLQHVSAVQISHHQVGAGYTNTMSREAGLLYIGTNRKIIIPKNGIIRLNLMHSVLQNSLSIINVKL